MQQNVDEPAGDGAPAERERLAEVYAKLAPSIRRIGAGHALNADDLVQDACERMLRGDRPTPIRDPVRYLFRVVRNLVVDRQRSRTRETALFDAGANLEAVGHSFDPERILDGKQRLDRVLAAVRDLPPRCREAFELLRFEGLSYVGIARRMGISTSMVEKHIAEAMMRLAKALSSIDGTGT